MVTLLDSIEMANLACVLYMRFIHIHIDIPYLLSTLCIIFQVFLYPVMSTASWIAIISPSEFNLSYLLIASRDRFHSAFPLFSLSCFFTVVLALLVTLERKLNLARESRLKCPAKETRSFISWCYLRS